MLLNKSLQFGGTSGITHINQLIFDILGVQAYLAGLTFALAASPCSTPVLATLLGYVATSKVFLKA